MCGVVIFFDKGPVLLWIGKGLQNAYHFVCICSERKWSRSVVFDSLRPVDCSPPSSSVHGILQARILEWVAVSFCICSRYCHCPPMSSCPHSSSTHWSDLQLGHLYFSVIGLTLVAWASFPPSEVTQDNVSSHSPCNGISCVPLWLICWSLNDTKFGDMAVNIWLS